MTEPPRVVILMLMMHDEFRITAGEGPTLGSVLSQLAEAALGLIQDGLSNTGRWLMECVELARQRRALSRLDDRLLRDIGVTRAQARREVRKPFWRR